jgi:methyltransferase (TIGR00027 family)
MEMFLPAPQRLFEDEILLALLPSRARFLLRRAAIRAALTALFEASAPGIRGVLLCRTRRIDDAVRDAVQRALPALVILGAGLDTRPYRLTELTGINVLELDLPQVQAFKKRRLSRFGALPPNVHFIPIDFNTQRLDDALVKGGVSPSERAIFVWEGVSQYLKAESVDSVLGSIAKWPNGTELVFTYGWKS